MNHNIEAAIQYANDHPEYRASIGIISTGAANESLLSWAAYIPGTDDYWYPEKDMTLAKHPAATWKPLTPNQLRLLMESRQRSAIVPPNQQSA